MGSTEDDKRFIAIMIICTLLVVIGMVSLGASYMNWNSSNPGMYIINMFFIVGIAAIGVPIGLTLGWIGANFVVKPNKES